MVTYSQLHTMDFSKLTKAAETAGNLAAKMALNAFDVEQASDIPPMTWSGQDANAASDLIASQPSRLFDTSDAFKHAQGVVDDLVTALKAAQGELIAANDEAKRAGLSVQSDGTVFVPPGATEHQHFVAGQVAVMIGDALRNAGEADTNASTNLEAQALPTDPDKVPRGKPPKDVKAWWDSLSDKEKQAYIQQHPEMIGNLDGIAKVDQDKANRIALDDAIERTKQELADLEDDPSFQSESTPGPRANNYSMKDEGAISALERRVQILEGLKSEVDPQKHPGRMLLGFDHKGDGKAIIATGNPDTASNVVTHVPGTGSDLEGVAGLGGSDSPMMPVDAMVNDANAVDPNSTVGIMWQGYDAPDGLTDAAVVEYAEDGAPDLANFQEGLDVTHQGEPSHNTVVGHSYGSTVVGHAMEDHGMRPDDTVFAGSPGVGADHVSELGVDPSQVHATRAENDVIGYVPDGDATVTVQPRVPVGPITVPGPEVEVPIPDAVVPDTAHIPGTDTTVSNHGLNPTDHEFGAQVFESAPGSGDWLPGDRSIPAHSEYWDEGNPARAAITDIVLDKN